MTRRLRRLSLRGPAPPARPLRGPLARALPSPLWRKAPLALLRHPPVAVAVAVGALLVALAAASSPLFVTAAGAAALTSKLEEITSFGAGVAIDQQDQVVPRSIALPGGTPGYARRDRALAGAFAGLPSLSQRVETAATNPLDAARAGGGETVQVRLMARTGVMGHVRRLAGRAGSGVWIPDSVATTLHLRPGDELELTNPASFDQRAHRIRVRVDGVYRALASEPEAAYWTNFYNQIYPASPDASPPAPFVLAPRGRVVRLYRSLGGGELDRTWEFPVDPRGLTVAGAKSLDRSITEIQHELGDPSSPLARDAACAGSPCGFSTSLPAAIVASDQEVDAVSPPATLLAAAGTIIALAVVAAAGAYAVARRRVEARLLFARGESVGAFVPRTVVEALVPALLGGLAGFGIAVGLVAGFEPGGALDARGLERGAVAAAAGLAVALVLLAAAAGFAFLRQYETGLRGRRWLAWIPWELPLLGLAAYFYWDLRGGGGLTGGGSTGVTHPTLAVFLFPLFLVAGVAGLAARVLRHGLRALGPRGARLPLAPYLALRRLAAAQGLAVILVAACAVALGAFLYAQTLVASLDHAVRVKAHVAIGSDVQGTINPTQDPGGFPFPTTKVTLAYPGASSGSVTGPQFDLMEVDPGTLPGVVYWESAWGPPPAELARALERPDGRRLPVVVAGGSFSGGRLFFPGGSIPIRVVATVSAFPGMTASRPLVVASRAALARVTRQAGVESPLDQPTATTLVWAKGPPGAVGRALASSPLRPYYVQTTQSFLNDADIKAETRTLSFLRAIGVAAGLLAVLALLLYLQARQRSQVVASALSRRMGLGGRAEVASLALELAVVLLLATALAAAVSLTAARFVVGKVDPLAAYPPAPLFQAPLGIVGIAVGCLLAIALAGGWLASRAASRADFGEAMRLG